MKNLQLDLAFPARLLVLLGGGEFSFGETREIDEFLVANMPAGRRRIAFFPTGSGSAEYAGHFGAYIRGIAPDVETVNVPVYRGRDGRRPKHGETVKRAGLVYLGGGVTNNIAGALIESPIEAALREAASAGAVVAAIGAAASVLGIGARDMRGVSPSIPGLGWLRSTVIEAPFAGSDDGLRRLMSLPDVRVGVGIPPGTALAIRADGSTEVIGSGQIAVYRKG